MKLHAHPDDPRGAYTFYCPGCGFHHAFYTRSIEVEVDGKKHRSPAWDFNGDMKNPTFSPSLLNRRKFGFQTKEQVCHLFLRNGRIEYLSDCTHELAGKTLNLPETWLRG